MKSINQTIFSLCIVLMPLSSFSQGYYFGDSKPISVSVVSKDIPVGKMPVNLFVKNYVEEKIAQWQKKGEFEKTSDYQSRVTERNREIEVQKFSTEAISTMKKQAISSIDWHELRLSIYDADNETFLIKSVSLGDFAISVPMTDAQYFKENFNSIRFENQDFYINNNRLHFSKVDMVTPDGRIFRYDSNQETIYSTNQIAFNFKPIDVNVQSEEGSSKKPKLESKITKVGSSDVDIEIPVNSEVHENSFAVIIANENYQQEVQVQFAINDGKAFKEYCEKTLGIPSKNIHFVQDATFGNMKSELKWINDVASAYGGKARLILYFAGHGMPNELDKTAYLLPIDGFSSDFETAIKLDDLYARLSQHASQSVTVFLDACFSGSIRDNGMLANARSVKIKPKNGLINGNMVVFSAATGDETAYPYIEKQHGLFTYFLLKKIQETKGDVDYQTLADYVIENVRQQSIVINQKSQTPQVNVSVDFENQWSTMKLK